MKISLSALAAAALTNVACAQSPVPPEPPQTPDVSTVTEDCGEGCSRTVTKIVSSETGEDGSEIVSKHVEVIELHAGDHEDIDISVDVEEMAGSDGKIRKKVKVVTMGDGEITPEIRAKIDAMIGDLDGGENVWHQEGDGVMVFNTTGDAQKMRVIIREDGHEYVTGDSDVKVEQTENEDGSRTIRVVPEDGGDTTVITIKTEKSSKIDN